MSYNLSHSDIQYGLFIFDTESTEMTKEVCKILILSRLQPLSSTAYVRDVYRTMQRPMQMQSIISLNEMRYAPSHMQLILCRSRNNAKCVATWQSCTHWARQNRIDLRVRALTLITNNTNPRLCPPFSFRSIALSPQGLTVSAQCRRGEWRIVRKSRVASQSRRLERIKSTRSASAPAITINSPPFRSHPSVYRSERAEGALFLHHGHTG